MTEEEKLAQNPMYNDESCKVVQAAAAKAGYNLMCAGDEEQVDVVLPGGEECEKQVQVLSKYGMTAVCDETDDAVAEAARFGIHEEYAVNYHCDPEGTALNYEVVSDAICNVRASRPLAANWKQRIEEDYKGRKKKTLFF